jgi:hypothetical protein
VFLNATKKLKKGSEDGIGETSFVQIQKKSGKYWKCGTVKRRLTSGRIISRLIMVQIIHHRLGRGLVGQTSNHMHSTSMTILIT